MKAFVVERYGKSGLRAADVPEPTVGLRDVLVRVSAAGINPLDKMVRNGEFKRLLGYKTPFVLGHDVSGVVTRVGADVRDYKVGDEIYSRPRDLRIGSFAEYLAIDHGDVALKPTSLTMAEAAAVPLVALAAWQALADFADSLSGHDVVLDSLGGDNLAKSLTVLRPGGLAISVVGPPDTAFAEQIGRPLLKPVMALMSHRIRKQARKLGVRYSFFFMRADGARLKTLAGLYEAGTLRPILDRTFPFDETLEAMAYVEQGRAKGKIVVNMQS